MVPHEAERYMIRSGAERADKPTQRRRRSRHVMAKAHSKATLHLMFSVITLFADQLQRLLVELSFIG